MRDDGYREDLMDKLALYASAGIRLGENLIVTFDDEKGGVNMELVEAMLRDRMFSQDIICLTQDKKETQLQKNATARSVEGVVYDRCRHFFTDRA